MEIRFAVIGTPQPQGSVRAFTPKGWDRPVLTSTNKNLKPWRQEVSAVAQALMRDTNQQLVVKAPVWMIADFYFDKPKSVKTSYKITKPDEDKLLRAVGDALTGIVYKDDSQLVTTLLRKQFGTPSRIEIIVTDNDKYALDAVARKE